MVFALHIRFPLVDRRAKRVIDMEMQSFDVLVPDHVGQCIDGLLKIRLREPRVLLFLEQLLQAVKMEGGRLLEVRARPYRIEISKLLSRQILYGVCTENQLALRTDVLPQHGNLECRHIAEQDDLIPPAGQAHRSRKIMEEVCKSLQRFCLLPDTDDFLINASHPKMQLNMIHGLSSSQTCVSPSTFVLWYL